VRTGRSRPGESTDFIDNAGNEALLRVGRDVQGESVIAFRLYDAAGALVAETDDFTRFPSGISVIAADGEVLLYVPEPPADQITYRLYNSQGRLLTCSDGLRTQVFAFLGMKKGLLNAAERGPVRRLRVRQAEKEPSQVRAATAEHSALEA